MTAHHEVDYTNHEGKRAVRRIVVRDVYFGTFEPYHVEPQWLYKVWDLDREAERVYAQSGVHSWNGVPVAQGPDKAGEREGRPIEEAPRDGTPIIAWGAPSPSDPDAYEWRQTRWTLYGEGSIAHARFKAGQGPEGYWDWFEPMHSWGSSWEPTRFIDLPALTPSAPIAAPVRDVGAREKLRQADAALKEAERAVIAAYNTKPRDGHRTYEMDYASRVKEKAFLERETAIENLVASLPAPTGDVLGEAQTQETKP